MAGYQQGGNADGVALALLDAARTILESDGLDHVTIRSVSAGAGVSTMNVYSRFGGKDGLLDVLFAEGHDELREQFEALPAGDLPATVRAIARTYRQFGLDRPARYELMFGGESRAFTPSERSVNVARRWMNSTVELLERAARFDGAEPSPAFDAVRVWTRLWVMLHGAYEFELGQVAASTIDWSEVSTDGVAALVEWLC